jgi:tRNA threonylcarbamoyladenosine biosynthesis protein TsaB
MIILSIRTDKPEADIALHQAGKELASKQWLAHKQLSSSIHTSIQELLKKSELDWGHIGAIVYYGGPGSFTGLRIGAAVANSLATSLGIRLVQTDGDDWITNGLAALRNDKNDVAAPNYGAAPKTSMPTK